MYIGTFFELLLGVILIIVGGYKTACNILDGSFTALLWLVLAILGSWTIDKGCREWKQNKYEKE